MKIETTIIHAGQAPDPSTGALMPPIFQTSTYAQQSPGKHKGYEYSRTGNPTRTMLEKNIAALEGARFGLAFASGCAAETTTLHTLEKGAHIISSDDVYGGTYRLFTKVFQDIFEFSFVDMTKVENVERAFQKNTKLIWIESPTNPLLKLVDLKRTIDIAHSRKALAVVDNTFMSPYFQQPHKFGADITVHFTTKYLNGHSDVVGGALTTNSEELWNKIKFLQNAMGAIPGPFDSWLVLRGIKTLHIRMERHEKNAMEMATFLSNHKKIERVIYPGLPSHPQYDLAQKQMSGSGGMMSLVVRGGLAAARKVLERVKIFSLAESLGGVESLIEHPAIMTHASIPTEVREKLGISDGLIRLSVGLENVEDLKEDLSQALS